MISLTRVQTGSLSTLKRRVRNHTVPTAVQLSHSDAHAEDADALIAKISRRGMKVGVALKPGTPVEVVLPYCHKVDMVLVMTVEPGFGGQSFMPDMMSKVQALRSRFPTLIVEVDGGLGEKTIDIAAEAGEYKQPSVQLSLPPVRYPSETNNRSRRCECHRCRHCNIQEL